MKIQTKILSAILVTIITSSILLTFVNLNAMNRFSGDSQGVVFDAVLNGELDNLKRTAADNALFVKEYLHAVITDLESMYNFADALFNNRINISATETYWADTLIDPRVPSGSLINDYYGFGAASWEKSTIYMPNVKNATAYAAAKIKYKNIIDLSSVLEIPFKATHKSNPGYIWIYMGFEEGGLFRQLPWNDMSWAREINYDPRQENWYKNAVAADGLNIFLDMDPESGLVLTMSRPVKYDNGSLVGVISLDLPLETVLKTVSNKPVFENGYAFMIDSQFRTLLHPVLLDNDSKFGEDIISLELIDANEKQGFSNILNELTQNYSQVVTFSKNSELWYLSIHPVEIKDFWIGVVVPKSDVINVVDQVNEPIRKTTITTFGLFLLVALFSILLAAFVSKQASEKIVAPIKELTEVTELITKGNLDRNISGGSGSQEIYLLSRTFEGLVTALRFGNEEYYRGDINRAYDNYQKALELFSSLNNKEGVGICYNNIGNVHKIKGNLKDANKFYRNAIAIANELLETASEEEKPRHILALASRYNNLGLLYIEIEEYDQAEMFLQKALEYDRMIDNARGFAVRYGNLGKLYLARGDVAKAKEAFDESMQIAENLQSTRAIANAKLNYGIYYRHIGDTSAALRFFAEAVELANDLDRAVVLSALVNAKEIHEEVGNQSEAKKIDDAIREFTSSLKRKEVIFVLDYSGSMAGKRIKQAIKGIRSIFNNQVNDDDYVGLIIFDNSSKTLFESTPKSQIKKKFLEGINGLSYPYGRTALYDAIGDALKMSGDKPFDQWIIVLTDGDDNSSRRYYPSKLEKLATNSVAKNLVIIGVGRISNRDFLEKLCEVTDQGKYIDVDDGVSNAIERAFAEVSSMLMETEVEGFVPDY